MITQQVNHGKDTISAIMPSIGVDSILNLETRNGIRKHTIVVFKCFYLIQLVTDSCINSIKTK